RDDVDLERAEPQVVGEDREAIRLEMRGGASLRRAPTRVSVHAGASAPQYRKLCCFSTRPRGRVSNGAAAPCPPLARRDLAVAPAPGLPPPVPRFLDATSRLQRGRRPTSPARRAFRLGRARSLRWPCRLRRWLWLRPSRTRAPRLRRPGAA